jgi:hypothetical protein
MFARSNDGCDPSRSGDLCNDELGFQCRGSLLISLRVPWMSVFERIHEKPNDSSEGFDYLRLGGSRARDVVIVIAVESVYVVTDKHDLVRV